MLPFITGEFGVVQEPELRFSDKGSAWIKIRGIAKDRVRVDGNWTDGDPLFIDIVTSSGAEHLYESIVKGDSIIVSGKLKQREYEKDGQKRTIIEIRADSVGVSTRWGPAKTKAAIDAGGSSAVETAQDMLGATEISDAAPF